MTDRYVHKQRSSLPLLLFGVAGAATLASLALPATRTIPLGPRLTIAAAALAMIVSGVVFSSLTITTDADHLSWHFGAGLLRKSVPLAEVVSAEAVRTTWVDGWGIHLTRRGWLYNVAGHNAVRVSLRGGRQFLLGTDEPAALAETLRRTP
jgi:hypothetical protein